MPKKIQRKYQNSQTVTVQGADVKVRYAIEWDGAELARIVRRAVSNQGGKADSGPIRVHVHPDDRRAKPAQKRQGCSGTTPGEHFDVTFQCLREQGHDGLHRNGGRTWEI